MSKQSVLVILPNSRYWIEFLVASAFVLSLEYLYGYKLVAQGILSSIAQLIEHHRAYCVFLIVTHLALALASLNTIGVRQFRSITISTKSIVITNWFLSYELAWRETLGFDCVAIWDEGEMARYIDVEIAGTAHEVRHKRVMSVDAFTGRPTTVATAEEIRKWLDQLRHDTRIGQVNINKLAPPSYLRTRTLENTGPDSSPSRS